MNPQFVADEVVTATKMNQLPKGAIGYAQITTSQSGIAAGVTDITGLSVAVTLVAGRRIKVTFYCGAATATVANDRWSGLVREGSTQLTQDNKRFVQIDQIHGFHAVWVGTPSAGAHTYKASVSRNGTGNLTVAAGTDFPTYILVEDIGGTA